MDEHEVDQISYDPDLAKEYFDKAYEANGSQKITITVKYADSNDTNRNWAEALQSHYQTLFGEDRLELTLQAVPAAIMYGRDQPREDELRYLRILRLVQRGR